MDLSCCNNNIFLSNAVVLVDFFKKDRSLQLKMQVIVKSTDQNMALGVNREDYNWND